MAGKIIQSINNSGEKTDIHLAEDDQCYQVDPKASVSINGASACITDLKAGDSVVLSGRPATSVVATRVEDEGKEGSKGDSKGEAKEGFNKGDSKGESKKDGASTHAPTLSHRKP